MASKGKFVNGLSELLSTPGVSEAIGAFANNRESNFPTLDSLSSPFGLTFDQQQQLVSGAMARDTAAAEIKLQQESNKAEKDRLKIAQQQVDIERAREEKNDLSESEELERQTAATAARDTRQNQFQAQRDERLNQQQIEAEQRAIENTGKAFQAEQGAIADYVSQNPDSPYARQIRLGERQAEASIAASYASASASRAKAQLAQIKQDMALIQQEREMQLAAGGPQMDPDYVSAVIELSDQKASTYKTLNVETGESETPGEILRAQREIDMANEYVKGRVPVEALTGIVDPLQITELAKNRDIWTNGSYEDKVRRMQEIFEEEEREIALAQQRAIEAANSQTDPVNNAAGGSVTQPAAAELPEPTRRKTPAEPGLADSIVNSMFPKKDPYREQTKRDMQAVQKRAREAKENQGG